MRVRYALRAVLTAGVLVTGLAGSSAAQHSPQPVSGQSWSAQPSSTQPTELASFFAQYFEERLRDEPEFATNVGRHEYDDRWSDLSKQGREQRRSHLVQR